MGMPSIAKNPEFPTSALIRDQPAKIASKAVADIPKINFSPRKFKGIAAASSFLLALPCIRRVAIDFLDDTAAFAQRFFHTSPYLLQQRAH
jgi:hypothetical protein